MSLNFIFNKNKKDHINDNKELKTLLSIQQLNNELINGFNQYSKVHWKRFNIKDVEYSSIDPFDLMTLLMFGESNSYNSVIKKLDYNKNKNILKTMIKDSNKLSNSVSFLRALIIYMDNYLEQVLKYYETLDPERNGENKYICKSLYDRLHSMLMSFSDEVFHMRDRSTTLKHLVDYTNGCNEVDSSLVKTDTLKRFYFSHVYALKNNVVYFNKNNMLFGEIDNIMRNFDTLFDFLFGDCICIYQTIKNQTDTIITNIQSKSTK